jgi:hypothetical protein
MVPRIVLQSKRQTRRDGMGVVKLRLASLLDKGFSFLLARIGFTKKVADVILSIWVESRLEKKSNNLDVNEMMGSCITNLA